MAAYLFTKAIFEGQPINLFNMGDMKRDFTYIDDVVPAIIRVLEKPPVSYEGTVPHQIYNVGNSRPEDMME